jgi:hypothetical protein
MAHVLEQWQRILVLDVDIDPDVLRQTDPLHVDTW